MKKPKWIVVADELKRLHSEGGEPRTLRVPFGKSFAIGLARFITLNSFDYRACIAAENLSARLAYNHALAQTGVSPAAAKRLKEIFPRIDKYLPPALVFRNQNFDQLARDNSVHSQIYLVLEESGEQGKAAGLMRKLRQLNTWFCKAFEDYEFGYPQHKKVFEASTKHSFEAFGDKIVFGISSHPCVVSARGTFYPGRGMILVSSRIRDPKLREVVAVHEHFEDKLGSHKQGEDMASKYAEEQGVESYLRWSRNRRINSHAILERYRMRLNE